MFAGAQECFLILYPIGLYVIDSANVRRPIGVLFLVKINAGKAACWFGLFVIVGGIGYAQTGANVMLVVNKRSEDSKAIADYYARRRAVPPINVCQIDTPDVETIGRYAYNNEISGPVRRCLETRKLTDKILYIVTTLGVPLRIDGIGGRNGEFAAVDSELTLLYTQIQLGLEIPLMAGYSNPYFMKEGVSFEHPRFPIYLVTRLAAYDRAGVFRLIDSSLQAVNRGKFVIDLLDHDNTNGNSMLEAAVKLLPADRVVVDRTDRVLKDRTDVIGYASWGSNDPARKDRFLGFKWLPGAIMTEYVSTNGRTFKRPPDTWKIGNNWRDKSTSWADSPQSLIADYLVEGVTGAAGHVYEPYLHATPRPDLLLPSYFKGRNLAESYYVSIPFLSWQNVVVGDPLCRLR
jgi:uncharacterized protein (TIGR03790 family)